MGNQNNTANDNASPNSGKEQSAEKLEMKNQGAAASEMSETETLKVKLAETEQAFAALKDQLLRKAAEFENFKKRVENDFALIEKFSNEQIITELLPVLDDFRRFLKSTRDGSDFEAFYRGAELIFSKFMKTLESRGLKEVESEGKPFDVHYHEALLQIPKADVAPHTIIEEVEKGYALHDKVIRHAKVIVAGEPEPEAAQPSQNMQNSKTAPNQRREAAPDTSD